MAANPKQVLRILDYRGIDVRLLDDRLIARPRQGVLPNDMRRFIQHFRDLIVASLQEQERNTDTTTSVLAARHDTEDSAA